MCGRKEFGRFVKKIRRWCNETVSRTKTDVSHGVVPKKRTSKAVRMAKRQIDGWNNEKLKNESYYLCWLCITYIAEFVGRSAPGHEPLAPVDGLPFVDRFGGVEDVVEHFVQGLRVGGGAAAGQYIGGGGPLALGHQHLYLERGIGGHRAILFSCHRQATPEILFHDDARDVAVHTTHAPTPRVTYREKKRTSNSDFTTVRTNGKLKWLSWKLSHRLCLSHTDRRETIDGSVFGFSLRFSTLCWREVRVAWYGRVNDTGDLDMSLMLPTLVLSLDLCRTLCIYYLFNSYFSYSYFVQFNT